MGKQAGEGFVRRVTADNLSSFAPLLRDSTKATSSTAGEEGSHSGGTDPTETGDRQVAEGLFGGVVVHVGLPFTPASGLAITVVEPKGQTDDGATSVGGSGGLSDPGNVVLVAEIPGPGRWSQAAFTFEVFNNFFGGDTINLTHFNSDGSTSFESAKPIVKKSSNYCYELGAAVGARYPDKTEGRPIGVFVRLMSGDFQYRLLLPSDQDYEVLENLLDDLWEGSAQQLRRIIVDLGTLQSRWSAAPFAAGV